jgi:hypothetical protein
MSYNFVITFIVSHFAIKAEKELNSAGLSNELIPTPREIDSECGFSILIPGFLPTDQSVRNRRDAKSEDVKLGEKIKKILNIGKIKYDKIFIKININRRNYYEEIN